MRVGVVALLGLLGAVACKDTGRERYRMPSSSMEPTIRLGAMIEVDPRARGAGPGDLIAFVNPCSPDKTFVKRVIAVAGDAVEVRCTRVYVNGVALPRTPAEGPAGYDDVEPESGQRIPMKASRWREQLGEVSFDLFLDEDLVADEADPHDFPIDAIGLPRCPMGDGEAAPGQLVRSAAATEGCALQLAYLVPEDHVFVMGDNRSNSSDSRAWGAVPRRLIRGRVTGVR